MATVVVTAPERRVKGGLMPSLVFGTPGTAAVEGWYAEVEMDGALFEVSQLPGETDWTVDAAFGPGSSCPAFMNGFGARYLRTKVLRPEVAAVVEAAKPAVEVAPAMTCQGHDLPGYHRCTDLCSATDCKCREDW